MGRDCKTPLGKGLQRYNLMRNLSPLINSSKNIIKRLWTIKESFRVLFNYLFIGSNSSSNIPKLYYGGALEGNRGGPSVKIKKLNKFFPEHYWDFNLTYLLSNSTYLSSSSIISSRVS